MKNSKIKFYNTLTHKKEIFIPINKNKITMYVCGPTVYGHAHIGNFRPAVVFDVVFRLLKFHYGEKAVKYARNITDIDDKIIKVSKETKKPIKSVTNKYLKIYHNEGKKLNILTPTFEPEATIYIAEMIEFIKTLIVNKNAYEVDGNVLFDVKSFKEYGKFSGTKQGDILAGARVEIASYKKNPSDFILWKPSKDDEPSWISPWGNGRPGWHIECSAMINKMLGKTIDIHGGGLDLRFPHHENEVAQSKCIHRGAPLANYWLHNGFIEMRDGKMSKSVGNVVMVNDLLKKWHGEVVRFSLLSTHYRQPLVWSEEVLLQSKNQLDRFYRFIENTDDILPSVPPEKIILALNDDLNTSKAISVLHELKEEIITTENGLKKELIASFKAGAGLLGLLNNDPQKWFREIRSSNLTEETINELIRKRNTAKQNKDFKTSDKIREHLNINEIILEDGPSGTTWRQK